MKYNNQFEDETFLGQEGKPMEVRTWGAGGDLFKATRYFAKTLNAGANQIYEYFKESYATVGKANTNMEDPGRLPAGIDMKIYRIGVRVFSVAGAAVTNEVFEEMLSVLKTGFFTFNLTGKQNLGIWPLTYFLPPVSAAVSEGTNNISQVAGLMETAWINLGKLPIQLQSQANFNVELQVPAAITDTNIKVEIILDGVEQRRS